jgi:hypothetical protein
MKKITEEFLRNIVNHLNFSNITMSAAAEKINDYFYENEKAFQVGETVGILDGKSRPLSKNTKAVILAFDPDGFGGDVPVSCRYFLKTVNGPKKYFWCDDSVMVKS